jgi:glycosyltransferase involved in cell wall biosynthesis
MEIIPNKKTLKKDRIINICLVAPYIYSLFNKKCSVPFGGAEVQLYLLSKEFSRNKKINVNIITGNYNLKNIIIEYSNGIKIFSSLSLEIKRFALLKYYIKLFFTLIKVAPDIVIQRGGGIETAICAFYCRNFSKKFIFSIATDDDVRKNRKIGIINRFYQYALNRMDFIVAQKQKQIKLLKRWKQRKIPNITVIKTGYEIQEINNIKKKDILWVGRAVRWKQAEIFITLAKDFPDQSFIMICKTSFDTNYWEELRIEAEQNKNLIFIPFVPFKEIDNYFYNAKVFINTSLPQEGFPNTYIQALKNVTPVIALNVDPDNFLYENRCGFNCKGDLNKIRIYLNKLLKNKEFYNFYSKNGYEYVKKNHNINHVNKEWIKLFENLT